MAYNTTKDEFVPKAVKHVTTEDEARQIAIDYQNWSSEQALSYAELIFFTNYFEALATKFNLTDEFRENGVI